MLRQYIVTLAGSAGSLEAILEIFDHTPLNNASYVILQHLPKGYTSQLKSILRKHSKLQIVEAQDGSPIENDKIYYAPANDFLSISDSKIRLITRRNGVNRAIDIFLNALALNENHKNAIAVFLSGLGTDGTTGAQSIKKAGGTIIVQSLDTCQFPDLPGNVLKQTQVDYIATPQDIPSIIRTLADYTHLSKVSSS